MCYIRAILSCQEGMFFIFLQSPNIFVMLAFLPPANKVWSKVMFLHLSVILFMPKGGVISACNGHRVYPNMQSAGGGDWVQGGRYPLGKVMFLQASVCPQRGGGVCLSACWDTPRSRPPRSRHPPWSRHPPPGTRHPTHQADAHPPGQTHPQADTHTPVQTPPCRDDHWNGGLHPTGMQSMSLKIPKMCPEAKLRVSSTKIYSLEISLDCVS